MAKKSKKLCACGHSKALHDEDGICQHPRCAGCEEFTVMHNDFRREDVEALFDRVT